MILSRISDYSAGLAKKSETSRQDTSMTSIRFENGLVLLIKRIYFDFNITVVVLLIR